MKSETGSMHSWAKYSNSENPEFRHPLGSIWFSKGGDLNPKERHSRDTRDDGTVPWRFAPCALPLYCHSIVVQILVVPQHRRRYHTRMTVRHHCGQTLSLSPGCGIPPLPLPPLKKSPILGTFCLTFGPFSGGGGGGAKMAFFLPFLSLMCQDFCHCRTHQILGKDRETTQDRVIQSPK